MTDSNQFCPGCMSRLADNEKPCPRCGFSWENYETGERELPPLTIVGGRYLLGKKIGAGGFGITYIAMDLREERKTAVKEFFPARMALREGQAVRPAPDADEEDYQRAREGFRREARLLSRFIGVDAIAAYRDYIEENETAYLVMNYVEGINLRQAMREAGKPFTQERALELMRPVLLAAEAMHRQGVLHRDISPENLILGPDGRLTLIDFGAAREYSLSGQENMTVIIKRGYAPEEQYRSGSRLGPWTDLYACCAVLYQMVSGILPQEAASRRNEDHVKPLSKIEGVQVTEAFSRAVEKGMTIFAAERYPSVRLLMNDLYPEESGAEIDAEQSPEESGAEIDAEHPPEESAAEPEREQRGKSRRIPPVCFAALGAVVLLGVVLALVFGGQNGIRKQTEETSGTEESPGAEKTAGTEETFGIEEGPDAEEADVAEEASDTEEEPEAEAQKESLPIIYGNVQEDGTTWINTRQQMYEGQLDPGTGNYHWEKAMDLVSDYTFSEEEITVSTTAAEAEGGDMESLWVYLSDGRKLRMEMDGQTAEYEYQDDTRICRTYDAQGNLVSTETTRYEDGREISCDYEYWDGTLGQMAAEHMEFVYEDDGSHTEISTVRYENETFYGVTTSVFDAYQLLKERTMELTFGDESHEAASYRYEYQRDAEGRLESMTETFTDPQFQTSVKTTEYTYDEYGNQLTALTYSENSGYAYLSNYMFSEFARQENGLFEPTGRVSGLEESKLP